MKTTKKQAAVRGKQKNARFAAPAAAKPSAKPFVLEGDGFIAEVKPNGLLTITVDLSQELRVSDSGKSMIIAQSERFQQLRAPGEWLNLMICRKPDFEMTAPAPAKKAGRK